MTSLPDLFQPLSPDFARNPYPAYAALRDRGMPQWFADFDIWLVSRFGDVTRVVQDKTLVRDAGHFMSAEERAAQQRAENFHDMPFHQRFVQTNMLESDGEMHDRLRRLVFREFTPGFVARQRGMVEGFVDRLIAGLDGREEIDFIEDFAAHIPGHVIGRVLGVPDEDCPQLRIWSERVVSYFDIDRTAEKKARAEAAVEEFHDYLLTLMAARRRDPAADVMSSLLAAHDAGQMSEDEVMALCMLILMAGHGSTIDVLGSGMHALMRFPDEMRRLRDEPGLIHTGIQEMFRFESPLPFFHRYVTEPCEIGGKAFGRGARIGVLYGAANRDPAAFDQPDRFDVGRSPNRHLAFGGGAHFCLGNHLARLDMEVIFSRLMQRFARIELVEDPIYKTGLSVRGVTALRLRLS